MRYTEETLADSLKRPDLGWHFLTDAVRQSRGAKLGWEDAALTDAKRRWQSPVRAESVALRWTRRSINVGSRLVRPRSPLSWVVTGTPAPTAPRQIIAVLDYHSGKVIWNFKTRKKPTK
jgi:hypothetical protein